MSDILDRIERYVEGSMLPDEQILFEAEMAANPQLARQVDAERRLRKALRYARQAALQRYLQRHTTRRLTGNIWGKYWTLMSAGIILIALVGWWMLPSDSPNNPVPTSLLEIPLPATSSQPSKVINFRRLHQWKKEAVAYRHIRNVIPPVHLLFFPSDSIAMFREKNVFLIYGVTDTSAVRFHIGDSTFQLVIYDSLQFRFQQ